MSEKDNYIKGTSLQIKNINEVPNVIHRLLLYDNEFPINLVSYLRQFRIHNKDFFHVLWNENDILQLMNSEETFIYKGYVKNIQKSDYARYIVLKYIGGIYLDFDIKMIKPLYPLYSKYKNDDCFFEENILKEISIERNYNYPLRIANYAMMHKPQSKHIQNILNICEKRSTEKIYNEEDIIWSTGPDVTSTYVNESIESLNIIYKKEYSDYFIHFNAGHWRYNIANRK